MVVDVIEGVLDAAYAMQSTSLFIETGTFRGRATAIASRRFDKVYTIELSDELFAESRLALAPLENVTCFHGDSADMLHSLMQTVSPSVAITFYLDSHFFTRGLTRHENKRRIVPSKSPFPLYAELEAIGARSTTVTDVVIVDDLHLWGKRSHHPHPNWKTLTRHRIKRSLEPRVMGNPLLLSDRFIAPVHLKGRR